MTYRFQTFFAKKENQPTKHQPNSVQTDPYFVDSTYSQNTQNDLKNRKQSKDQAIKNL